MEIASSGEKTKFAEEHRDISAATTGRSPSVGGIRRRAEPKTRGQEIQLYCHNLIYDTFMALAYSLRSCFSAQTKSG